MAKTRLQKSMINIIVNMIFSVIGLFLGLLRMRMFLEVYGSELNGIYQFILQFVGYLSIAEMGLAQLYNIKAYKFAANNDLEGLSAVYNGAKYFVRVILSIMLGMIVVIALFIQFIRPVATIPTFEIVFLFIIMCLPSLISQMLLPNYVILNSRQESYRYNFWIQLFTFIKVLLSFYYIPRIGFSTFVWVEIFLEISGFAYIKYHTDNATKDIKKITSRKEIVDTKNTYDFIKIRIATVLIENTDSVVITKIFSFVALSIFSSYAYITNILLSNVSILFDSCLHSLGHLFASNEEYSDYIVNVLKSIGRYLATYIAIMTIFFAERIVMFIAVNADVSYRIDNLSLIIVALAIFIKIYLRPFWLMVSAKGNYSKAKKMLYVEAVLNIVISILLVYKIGVFGALLGTFIAKVIIALPNYFYASSDDFSERKLVKEFISLLFCLLLVMTFNFIFIRTGLSTYISNTTLVELFCVGALLAILVAFVLFILWLIFDLDIRRFFVENANGIIKSIKKRISS